jgi:Zn-dependent metalloprotease
VDLVDGMYLTIDQLRPAGATFGLPAGANITFDMKGSISRFLSLTFPLQTDIGSDADNVWSDPGVVSNPGIVDAHAYAGYTYDYYFRRFGRQGLDNNNLQIWSFTNIVRATDWPIYFGQFSAFFVNAAYLGGGDIYYGVGLPSNITAGGKFWSNFAGALDVVAHELSHGVTQFTSNLIYQGESGALNEAFSDMMGQSAQFFIKPPADAGASSFDWLLAEDIAKASGSGLNGIRSMSSPSTFGDPDHYSIRFLGTSDGGGVHTNSGIMNHAFFLAIMGGTNRISGLATVGVGFANRDQIERAIYRAFTQLMTSSANFSAARAATIQAARDLFGTNSAAERALTQAWAAVGVV